MTMGCSQDTVCFCFPAHSNPTLSKMNVLRETHTFCDITLLLGTSLGPAGQHRFHGHRVVLAASSDFLRDQFLLHEGQAELYVGVISNMEAGKRLILSCFTGLLEVPLRDLVNYLTAASALQMSQVVEKCAQVLSQYLGPMLAFLNMERPSKEKTIQQADNHQEEKDAAQSITSIQEGQIEKRKEVVIQTKSKVGQRDKPDRKEQKEGRDDRDLITGKSELPEDAECFLKSLDFKEIRSIKSIGTGGSSSQHEELVDSSCNQDEKAEKEQRDKKVIASAEAQLHECRELVESNLLYLSGEHLPKIQSSGTEQTEDSGSISAHRPYLCRRCNRVFQHQDSYRGHLKQHRQYLCLVCGKGFSQKTMLIQHIHIHTTVRPLQCSLCRKMFSQTASLAEHLNLGSADKIHNHNSCAMSYAHKSVL
ncbi:zinc finger and BTB domain-containing protein 26-like [Antennarius striatus]|uniref:zinc finger and BTB domain-containing protein 26-like n=1 Tax=Antennarius striatus TaxID=241820 RepID=UPI0035B06977